MLHVVILTKAERSSKIIRFIQQWPSQGTVGSRIACL
jgi:hypothetical protein